jgi:uroporphyrinogen-III decarboxylase
MTEIMMAVLLEPDMIHKLLDKCTQFLIQYVKAFRDAEGRRLLARSLRRWRR